VTSSIIAIRCSGRPSAWHTSREWTDAQIVAGIYDVSASGRPLMAPMPWPYYAGRITDGDLKAIIAYLRSLPPVRNAVARPESPKTP